MSIEAIIEEARGMELAELRALSASISELVRQAEAAAAAPEAMDEIVRERGEAQGRKMGDPWVRPSGAVDAYPTGAVVTHKGSTWRNLTPANVWEPGESGWREVPAEDAVPPAYVQPTGAHDAYSEGDRVTFDGAVWRSLMDGNVWSPDELVHSWFREGSIAEGEEPAPEPTPEPGAGAPLWAPGLSLGVGDRVEHNGVVYVVQQAHTSQAGWEPTNLPALFTPEES